MNLRDVTKIETHKLSGKRFFVFDIGREVMVYNESSDFYGSWYTWESFKKAYVSDGEILNLDKGES